MSPSHRVRTLALFVLPSMLVGGLVFAPAPSQAHDGRDAILAYADDGVRTTKADRDSDVPRRAPRPQTAQGPTPPRPPAPPRAPKPPGGFPGVNVTINGNKIDLSGIDGMVRGQLDGVREMIRNNPNIPPHLRDKILARIDRVRGTVDKRLAKLKGKSLEQVGEELEQMGEEIEQAMEGLEDELEQLGEHLGKDIEKKFKNKNFKFKFDHDDDDDDDDVGALPMAPDLDDVDDGDMREALDDLRGMAIKPQQKEQIQRIRIEADRTVSAARGRLDELSKKLEVALADPRTSTADIERYVDQISAQEASIRKARIVSWVKARAVLDDGQRKRIEAAAGKRSK